MTEFTKANPFEFEGIHVYHDGLFGDISHHDTAATRFMDVKSNERIARAMHAFIDAENNEWHEDGDGFRKGPWVVQRHIGKIFEFMVSHVDFPKAGLVDTESGSDHPERFASGARPAMRSFLEWHAATYPKQPVEPTGLGAVVEVAGKRWVIDIPGEACPWWRMGKREGWGQLIARGPVTVLSEGVTS